MATEFVTSNDEHWYQSRKKENIWYPSVTTVLGDSFPKGKHFEKYLAELDSWEESREILKSAGKRGTNVHNATEELEKGEVLQRTSFTAEEWKMLEGFVRFYLDNNPEPIAIEQSVISDKIQTGGTIDRVYVLDGIVTLLDIKTSSAIHDNYWVQTATYRHMWEENKNNPRIERTAILRLVPRMKKGYELKFHDIDEMNEDFEVWKAVRTIYNYRNPKAGPKLVDIPDTLSLKTTTD